jgi:lysophospholipase L1-like esterase
MRVVLVGDSHLTETSPRRPTTKLPPRLRRCGLDVLVAAVGGANSRDVLRQQIPDDADWVVLSVGVNGSTPWKSVGPDEFTANCERMLGTSGTQRYLVLGPGLVIERGVAGERTNKGLSAYAAALRRTAVAHSARFVSMADLLNDSDLAEDGVHFNDSGYRKLADRVLVELVSSQA